MLAFDLAAAAGGFESARFHVAASGFGEIALTLPLPPAGGDDAAGSTTMSGTVKDTATGEVIAGAIVSVTGTTSMATADGTGAFEVSGIECLEFTLTVSAPGYLERDFPIKLARHGVFNIDPMLDADPAAEANRSFQVISSRPLQDGSGANTVQRFEARIINLITLERDTVITGEVLDGAGLAVATVGPYAPGTEFAESSFGFAPGQELELVVPWDTAQFPPGSYRVRLRVVEPGTITRELPTGVVLASGETGTSVTATRAVAGELAFDSPLIQANAGQSAALSALVINTGNVPLRAARLSLTIADPADGEVLHTAQATVESIAVGGNALVDFGAWIASRAGDLAATVRPDDTDIDGEVRGTLFVGDKASARSPSIATSCPWVRRRCAVRSSSEAWMCAPPPPPTRCSSR